MTLRRTLTGLTLCMIALALFMGCVETGPPPPMVVMDTPPPPPPQTQLYFVNVSSLALREGPTTAAPQVGTLHFNDEVAILEINSGWARVGDVSRDRTGWASMRYLQPVPADRPRSAPRKRRRRLPRSQPSPPQPPRPCRGGSFGQVQGGISPSAVAPRLTSPGLVRI